MALQPTQTPGLWSDPRWDGKSPATFAILIGVSAYRHLKDGSDPADTPQTWMREAASLGQLYVSALTARRMMEWLATTYRMTSAPLARCWLLTAPTEYETLYCPDLKVNPLEPTFDNCRNAILSWAAEPMGLPGPAQQASRALFFFSGHGLESTPMNQLLLPSDYLTGPFVNYNHCINAHNIRLGMNAVPVGHRYYFLDACRNDTDDIRQQSPVGTPILPVQPSNSNFRDIEMDATLSATTSTNLAWQPKRPDDGETLFGQAMLSGLVGTPNIKVTQDGASETIRFGELLEYVRNQVPALLREGGSTVPQIVQPTVLAGYDGIVTELAPGAAQRVAMVAKGAATQQKYGKSLLGSASSSDPIQVDMDSFSLDEPGLQAAGWQRDFGVGHRLFGHESVTALFSQTLRVAALGRQEWVEPERVRVLSVDRREAKPWRGTPQANYKLRLIIEDPDTRGHWLQFQNFGAGGAGILLPTDPSRASAFELDVTMLLNPQERVLSLDAVPWDKDETSPVYRANDIWRKYQGADLSGAVRRLEDGAELRALVKGKMVSPLAATIAAAVLLRANRTDLMADWVRNIANWFEHLPDGPIFWAEQLWRTGQGDRDSLDEVARYMSIAAERGVPMTSEAMGYADALYARLALEEDMLPPDTLAQLAQNADALRGALRFFRPGGLFSSFFGFDLNTRLLKAEPAAADKDGAQINGVFLPTRS